MKKPNVLYVLCAVACVCVCFHSVYTPFHEETSDTGTKVWQSLANAFILLGVVVVMTIFLILLYKYRCYKVCKSS